jgi:hypothetical protein
MSQTPQGQAPGKYAAVNGLEMYYEIHGTGDPLVVIHGSFMTIELMGKLVPEHAVEMLRLRGGGIFGDIAGLPAAQLPILPGTTHVGILERADWLVPMVEAFRDAPMPVPVASNWAR